MFTAEVSNINFFFHNCFIIYKINLITYTSFAKMIIHSIWSLNNTQFSIFLILISYFSYINTQTYFKILQSPYFLNLNITILQSFSHITLSSSLLNNHTLIPTQPSMQINVLNNIKAFTTKLFLIEKIYQNYTISF